MRPWDLHIFVYFHGTRLGEPKHKPEPMQPHFFSFMGPIFDSWQQKHTSFLQSWFLSVPFIATTIPNYPSNLPRNTTVKVPFAAAEDLTPVVTLQTETPEKTKQWVILVILFPKHSHQKALGFATFSCWHGPISFQSSRFLCSHFKQLSKSVCWLSKGRPMSILIPFP